MGTRWVASLGARLSIVGVLAVGVGCTHQTAIVTEVAGPTKVPPADKPELPGIPFFPKKGVCDRETVWLEPQYMLTFSVEADGAPPVTHTLVISRAGYEASDTANLMQALTGMKRHYRLAEIYPDYCPSALGRKWDAAARSVTTTDKYKGQIGLDADASKMQQSELDKNVFLIANKAKPGTAPDYSRQDYINARSPWNGTSQVDAKIAADGTLNEASAQRDDETLTALASLVGDFTGASTAGAAGTAAATATTAARSSFQQELRELRAAGRTCQAEGSWPTVAVGVKYTFNVTTWIYQHDHKKQTDLDPTKDQCQEPKTVYDGSFTVTREDASGSSKKSDKAIEFSGQITLPESDKGKKKKDSASNADSSD